MPFPGNEIASRNKYLELKHWLMVVNPDEDVTHDELAFVCRKLELGPEGRITNAASDGRRPFAVDEFRQLGSRAVVPDEVGTLHVRVENLQDLERIWNEENCYKITQKYFFIVTIYVCCVRFPLCSCTEILLLSSHQIGRFLKFVETKFVTKVAQIHSICLIF